MSKHSQSGEKNLNNLPAEILIKIFEQVSLKDLLNLTAVSKSFNRIISDEPKFMNLMPLILCEEKNDLSWFGIRKYEVVQLHTLTDKKILDIFYSMAIHIKKLIIPEDTFNSLILNYSTFIKILGKCSNLKILICQFDSITEQFYKKKFKNYVKLNLEYFRCHSRNLPLFNVFFDNRQSNIQIQVKTLDVHKQCYWHNDIKDFLSKVKISKKFHISFKFIDDGRTYYDKDFQIYKNYTQTENYDLETLKVTDNVECLPYSPTNTIKIFEDVPELSLITELKISFDKIYESEDKICVELRFEKQLTNLKCLKLENFGNIELDSSVFKTVEKLILKNFELDLKIFESFPNLKYLTTNYSCEKAKNALKKKFLGVNIVWTNIL